MRHFPKFIIFLFLTSLFYISCEKTDSGVANDPESLVFSTAELKDSVSNLDFENLTAGSTIRGSHFRFTYPTKDNLAQGARGFDWICPTGQTRCNGISPQDKYHTGVDYGVGDNYLNRAIVAFGSGRVATVSRAGTTDHGLGNAVVIEHKMQAGNNIFSVYAHMNSIPNYISSGTYVTKGTVIGYAGKTGNNSGAGGIVHLHFELKNSNTLGSNPAGYYGYVVSSLRTAGAVGYISPANYINSANYFDDITLTSQLPNTIKRNTSFTTSVNLKNVFSQQSNIDLRLALYTAGSNPTFLGEIQTYSNTAINYSGEKAFTFSKSSISSAVGTNYELRLEAKVPNSTTDEWYTIPTLRSNTALQNPRPVSVTN
jgi:murein DD-endopeptidase MepM/ murein hydrolase activator NlpD